MVLRGQFYVRLEHDQWDFARERPAAYDAAIVKARYLAPYAEGHPSCGQPPDRLARAVREAERLLVVDPDIAPLCAGGVTRYYSAGRLRQTAAAQAVNLPLTYAQLQDQRTRDAFVEASLYDQRHAGTAAAPQLEFTGVNDPRFEVNLKMLRRVVRSVSTQMPVAFLQVTDARLMRGALAEAAAPIAATGVERVFLCARGFGEAAGADQLARYLEAVDAFLERGVEVVADYAGRLGPVLVHEGALGFSAGTMYYRQAPAALLASGGGGGAEVPYELPGDGWGELPRQFRHDPTLEPCPEPNCRAAAPDASIDDLREHRLHTLRRRGRAAATQTATELIRSLRASDQLYARDWANVLARRHAEAA